MQQVNLNLVPGGVNPIVYASQNDEKRTIRFELVSGGDNDVYVLSGNETITAKITKPDGTAITIPITNPGSGKHYVDLVNGTSDYDQDGVYVGEVSLVRNARIIGSANFILKVESDPYGNGKVIILSAHGSPANFNTDLLDNAVECKVDIAYNANGYKSALLVNTNNAPSEDSTPYLYRPSYANGYGYETLIGGTCGVNQLFNFSGSTTTIDGVTFTVNADNSITLSGTAENNIAYPIDTNKPIINGHKYLIKGGYDAHIRLTNTVTSALNLLSGISIKACDYSSNYTNFNLIVDNGTVISTPIIVYPMFVDLTAYFGTTIADYVYTLESGTSGAGITWLKNNGFFGADYYPYNSGALLSVKTSKKINRDINNVLIGEYPLDDIELRGILKLDSNNNLYYDGDTYSSSGEVVRKYDINTVNQYDILDTSGYGYTNIVYAILSKPATSKDKGYASTNLICKYPSRNDINNWDSADKIGYIFGGADYNKYWVGFPYGTSLADMKTALADMPFVYELATPTTETADAFTNPMIVDGNGTEEFVDGRTVEMPVGHETIYGEDMKARFTDFGVTVYGGEFNLTTGVLTSTKNADGTDKNPPDVYQLAPAYMPVRNGENYVLGNTNGDAYVKYYKKA